MLVKEREKATAYLWSGAGSRFQRGGGGGANDIKTGEKYYTTLMINCLVGFRLLAPATISEGAVSDEPNLNPDPTKAVDPEELAAGLEEGSTASAPDSLAFLSISWTRSAPAFFFDGPSI